MEGIREQVVSADGTRIALVTSGDGSPLLLVHGGMTSLDRWSPMWPALTARYRATAMDRRGRGSSGPGEPYSLEAEFDDVRAVAEQLARRAGRGVDVFGHSIGAVCVLGAAARGAPFRRIALYEPPGPETVPAPWLEKVNGLIAAGEPGRAMVSFLMEVVGLSREQVVAMRDTPVASDAIRIVSATMLREGRALARHDRSALAPAVHQPVLLLLGTNSPPWAGSITQALHRALSNSTVVLLPGQGHEAIDSAPALVADALQSFFSPTQPAPTR
jgi:pimeloyl-ACP methyl ester carboxylesterase